MTDERDIIEGAPEFITMQAIKAAVIKSRLDKPHDDQLKLSLGEAFMHLSLELSDGDDRDEAQMHMLKVIALTIRLLEEGDPEGGYGEPYARGKDVVR
jgi:hypothetical protein